MELQSDIALTSKNLDHLGIVAGVCKEIGLVKIIDDLTDSDPQRKISIGEAVYAMILNGLGFNNRTLYLTPEFFTDKPIEILMGRNVQAEDFNDDSLSRALDSCYKHGLEKIFYKISARSLMKYNVKVDSHHGDSTTFSVTGDKYKSEAGQINITQGYNKQNRHDLRQFIFQLISANKEGIPLFFKASDGNSSDRVEFPKVYKEYFAQMSTAGVEPDTACYYVADSAFYSKDNIKALKSIKWISRVPQTLKKVQTLLVESETNNWENFDTHKNYKYQQKVVYYGGIRQYWLIVLSEQAREREIKTLDNNVEKEHSKKEKLISRLGKKRFESAKEAREELIKLTYTTKLKYHQIQSSKVIRHACYKPGRPKSDAKPESYKYSIVITFEQNTKKIESEKQKKGKFILATNKIAPKKEKKKEQFKQQNQVPLKESEQNKQTKTSVAQSSEAKNKEHTEQTKIEELDLVESKLTADELLRKYKNDQQQVERGFRFLKDPLFLLDHVFLKLPRRIMALSMVMALCLLVYTLAQFKLRKLLKEQNKTVPNQVKKQIKNPTMRWIFQLFRGIHVIDIATLEGTKKVVVNINSVQLKIIKILGSDFEIYYGV